MQSVKVALVGAVALVVGAVGVLLAHAPPVVAGTNNVSAARVAALSNGRATTCQRVATLPPHTSAMRVSLGAGVGPLVHVKVYSDLHLSAQGEHPAGWGLNANVVVPVNELREAVHNALICTTLGPAVEPVKAFGVPKPGSPAKPTLKNVALSLEYLRDGPKSWWSLAPSTLYHIGLGHAASGTWVAYAALSLMLAACVSALRLAWRELK